MSQQKRPGLTRLTALRLIDPCAWRAEVTRALDAAGGSTGQAATRLGVSRRTMQRAQQMLRTETASAH